MIYDLRRKGVQGPTDSSENPSSCVIDMASIAVVLAVTVAASTMIAKPVHAVTPGKELREQKGVHDIIDAARRLADLRPSALGH